MAPDATALNANGCKTIPFEVWLLVLTRLKSECIFAKLDTVSSSTLTKYKAVLLIKKSLNIRLSEIY